MVEVLICIIFNYFNFIFVGKGDIDYIIFLLNKNLKWNNNFSFLYICDMLYDCIYVKILSKVDDRMSK